MIIMKTINVFKPWMIQGSMDSDLDKLDRHLYFLNKKIKFSLVNPLNLEEEKKKVFKDSSYNPQLTYKVSPHSLFELRKELMNLHFDDSILGKLLHHKRNELLKTVMMLEHIGTPRFTACALNVYGRPSKDLVQKARHLLALSAEEEEGRYQGVSSVKKFLDAILHQGLHKWKVKEKEMVVGASFDVGEKTLFIHPRRRFSENDLKRLIVHEIGTHITRAEHAKKKRHKLFLIGFPNYLTTEEGLAVYMEEKAGLLSDAILRRYAGRVIAVDLALQSSFSSVYTSLCEYFPKEDAFTLTMRTKRGMSDTSTPGALTKDYVYLHGYYQVKDYIKKGGSLDALYVGKVGIEHVPFLKYLE